MHLKPFTLACISALVLFPNLLLAHNPHSFVGAKVNHTESTSAYWTAERLRQAEPMSLPRTHMKNVKKIAFNEGNNPYKRPRIGKDGTPPTIELQPNKHPYFQPITHKDVAHNTLKHFDTGTLKQPFTSAQLTPTSNITVYPYRTTGKLFFTTPDGDKSCTASVIGQRILVTAGHCVHNGNNDATGWYDNFLFIPAYDDGIAPFLTWDVSYKVTSGVWYAGGGTVPNGRDWALLEIADQPINDVLVTIGSIVGTLGWQIWSTFPNHATILGYTNAFDDSDIMHQVSAQSSALVYPNNTEYGSDMSDGAGGSPWIQNFGNASPKQTGGLNSGRNRVVGVTSYWYNDATSLSNGSSTFDDTFVGTMNYICNRQAGNC